MKNINIQPLVFEGSKCTLKRSIEKNILGIFESYCYNEIDLPLLCATDAKIRESLVVPVAKQLSTTLKDCILPERLYFSGNVYKQKSYMGCDIGEISLSGVCLAGESNPKADAEVISIMINSLLGIGMTEFTISVSNAEFISGIAEKYGLNLEALKELICENNAQKLEEYLDKNNMESDIKKLILSLPTLFGDLNIFDEINMDILGEKSRNAISNIKRIYKLLCDYDMEKYIQVDLSIADNENYYDGMLFKGTVNKTEDFTVCSGGRCSSLAKNFGRNIPLVAGHLEISKITELIHSDADTDAKLTPLALVASDIPKLAYKVSFGLRAQGLKVEDYVSGASMIEAIEYGEEKGITIIIWVNEETAIMRNLKTGEMSETSVDKLLGN